MSERNWCRFCWPETGKCDMVARRLEFCTGENPDGPWPGLRWDKPGDGWLVSCGCLLPTHLSPRQSMMRAFLKGLTWGAYPRDYPEREEFEADERIEHIMREHQA